MSVLAVTGRGSSAPCTNRVGTVQSRSRSGRVGSSAWMDLDSKVHYIEEWASESEMRRRVRSEQFTSLLAIVESSRDPYVQFDFVSETRGLDYAAEIRRDSHR